MTKTHSEKNLTQFRLANLTLLQLMAVLATLGVLVNVFLHYFFA